jgi:Tfp pilus assembly protein PilZ
MGEAAESIEPVGNKRRHPRVVVNMNATIAANDENRDAVVIDVATGGAFIRTSRPARVGSTVSLTFRMLAERRCEASGRVVWRSTEDGRTGFAISFEDANPAMRSFTRSLAKLPPKLRSVYLADVLDPRIEVDEITLG